MAIGIDTDGFESERAGVRGTTGAWPLAVANVNQQQLRLRGKVVDGLMGLVEDLIDGRPEVRVDQRGAQLQWAWCSVGGITKLQLIACLLGEIGRASCRERV